MIVMANTAEACSEYLGLFSGGYFAKKVKVLKDNYSFGNAQQINTADTYDMYVEKFMPNGRHIGRPGSSVGRLCDRYY